jgi:type IV pilus biogenesis protein CpaD/CtpE
MRLPLLLAIAALGFAGCASAPKSELATTDDNGVDRARMAVIEQQALRSGVRVFWVNPPRKPSTPSGG